MQADINIASDVVQKAIGSWVQQAEPMNNKQYESRQQIVNGQLKSTIVLATTLVRMQAGTQITKPCRALLDTGAQLNIISKACVMELGLSMMNCHHPVHGIAGSSILKNKVRVHIRPWFEL